MREALACGCPVVVGSTGWGFSPYGAPMIDVRAYAKEIELALTQRGVDQRKNARLCAEQWFNADKTARDILALCDEILSSDSAPKAAEPVGAEHAIR